MALVFVRFACILFITACTKYAQGQNFQYVSVQDKLVQKTIQSFLEDYKANLEPMFAIVSLQQPIAAEYLDRSVIVDETQIANISGLAVPSEELVDLPGRTYRVNLLLNMQFNSTKFGGNPFLTVASAIYTCINETVAELECHVQNVLQNNRMDLGLKNVPMYAYAEAMANGQQYVGTDRLNFTAFEVQQINAASGHIQVEYYKFQINQIPVSCKLSILNNYTNIKTIYYDTSCFKYINAANGMSSMAAHLTTAGVVTTVCGLIAFTLVMAVFVSKRYKPASARGYQTLRFANPTSRAPEPLQVGENGDGTGVSNDSKSYHSVLA